MVSQLKDRLVDTKEERRLRTRVPVRRYVVVVVIGVLFYIGLAIVSEIGGDLDRHFFERGAVTALSSVFLAMASALTLTCFILHEKDESPDKWFWLLVSAAYAFLSLDEQLEFHEEMGLKLINLLGEPVVLRNWGDLVVAVYGVAAAVVVVVFLAEILRYPNFAELLSVGFGFYILTTLIDMTIPGTPTLKTIVEESAKLYAGTFFALAALAALLSFASIPRRVSDV